MTRLLKRIEAWAAHSPERSRLLIILLSLAFVVLAALFIVILAWTVLGST